MVEEEVHAIFTAQRERGQTFASAELEDHYLEILLSQRSFDEGPGQGSPYGGSQIEKMIGKCTLETGEPRAAKASYSFEYFTLLQNVNHLRLVCGGESNPLSGALREHLQLIKSQGKTVIAAEHRLYYLLDIADRVIYLENGRIAGDWTPEQLRALPAAQRQKIGLRAIDLQEERPSRFASSTATPVLALKNVTLAYQKHPVLQNISLRAAPGDVIAVVGRNGAGKTTFSRALCGLHKELLVFDEPTSGLDYDSMVRLAALIRRLAAMGKVIFIVTHDYEFVCRTCTRVLHLDLGGVQVDLPVSETPLPHIKEIFHVR